jgi:hypothetical protein
MNRKRVQEGDQGLFSYYGEVSLSYVQSLIFVNNHEQRILDH